MGSLSLPEQPGRGTLALFGGCVALLLFACKAKPSDGVFACASDDDCPSSFACREMLCRKASSSAPTGTSVEGVSTDTESGIGSAGQASSQLGAGAESAGSSASGASTIGAGGAGGNGMAGKSGARADVSVPPPPPPPFMPHTFVQLPSGRSLTAGGTQMRSEHFTLLGALGQSPSTGYPVRASANYRLVGGIVGVLQAGQ